MFHRRLVILLVLISVMMLVIIGRLFHLQILQGEHYLDIARRKIAYQQDIETTRGLILDRTGRVLATNEKQYDVCIYLRNYERLDDPQAWCAGLAALLDRPTSDVTDAIEKVEEHLRTLAPEGPEWRRQAELKYLRRRPQVILSGLSWEEMRGIRLGEHQLPQYVPRGVLRPVFTLRDALVRRYPCDDLAPHIIGRLARINPEEYKDKGYRFSFDGSELKRFRESDLIGRSGVEARYERLLRGARGRLRGVKDVREEVVTGMPTTRREPVPGRDIKLTIDARLQRLAERALDDVIAELIRKDRQAGDPPVCGAFVLIDPHNGDVLVAASSPRYNLNTVIKNWRTLAAKSNLARPLWHRATMGTYPIGSVFKVIVATAGLEENIISGHTEFTCHGAFFHGNQILRCTGPHGSIELSQAIERSCNVYFWNAGLRIGGKKLKKWAELMGLGVPAHADLGEARGGIPVSRSSGDTLNLAVGQGRILCTPLQVARMMGSLALPGKLPEARFCTRKPIRIHRIDMHPHRINVIRWGMRDVIHGRRGTARKTARVYRHERGREVEELIYAGKTGTAQTRRKDVYHAWFAGFAPFKTPKIAFACVIENTRGSGGGAAAPVVQKLFEKVFNTPDLAPYLSGETR